MSDYSFNDIFGINDAFKQIADAWNEGLEQTKRQSECKMRRFYLANAVSVSLSNRHEGVVLPNGNVVVYDSHYDNIQVFSSLDAYSDRYRARGIQWIDPEPEASK